MANSFSTVHVAVSLERFYEEFLLGTESFDKGIAQILEGYQHQVSLDRFFADGTDELRTSTFAAATKGDYIKDEKQILMEELQLTWEIDPKDFNVDRPWLWTQGPSANAQPSPALLEAVIRESGKRFRKNLENRLWNGGLGTLTGWIADIAAADSRGNTVAVTPAGAITKTNVISTFEAMLGALPSDVRDNPARSTPLKYVTTPAVRQAYGDAITALDFKNNQTTDAPSYFYQGIEVVSSTAMPANNIYLAPCGNTDESALKAAVWMDSDRFNIQMGKGHDLDDVWGVRVSYALGTNTKINGEIVTYLPA